MNNEAPSPMYVQEGPNAGKIADSNVAREIANLEKPARDRELELRRESETGLNAEQEKSVAVMEGLQEKYPNAFNILVDDKGRKVLFVDVNTGRAGALGVGHIVVSQEGIIGIRDENNSPTIEVGDIDPTKFIDAIPTMEDEFKKTVGDWGKFPKENLTPSGQEKLRFPNILIRKVDLSSAVNREALQAAFQEAQSAAVLREEKSKEYAEKMDPARILQDL